jgi:DNA-binding transcriptional ArsR family regulator
MKAGNLQGYLQRADSAVGLPRRQLRISRLPNVFARHRVIKIECRLFSIFWYAKCGRTLPRLAWGTQVAELSASNRLGTTWLDQDQRMLLDMPDHRNRFFTQSALLLSAMANPTRVGALMLLQGSERSVGSMCRTLNLNQSTLSQHLARLRIAGLVTTRRDAQMVFYSLTTLAAKLLTATADPKDETPGACAEAAWLRC